MFNVQRFVGFEGRANREQKVRALGVFRQKAYEVSDCATAPAKR
jgi:hypothetical protein